METFLFPKFRKFSDTFARWQMSEKLYEVKVFLQNVKLII